MADQNAVSKNTMPCQTPKIAMILAILLFLLQVISSSSSAQVLINEVQLNTSGATTQWVELYNSGNQEVDISGWSIVSLGDPPKEKVIDYLLSYLGGAQKAVAGDRIIPAKGFMVLFAPPVEIAEIAEGEEVIEEEWLDPLEETLILKNYEGVQVDRTPQLLGYPSTDCSWSRFPDGSDNWIFAMTTEGRKNSDDLCMDAYNVDRFKFTADKRVSGSGYVHTRTSIAGGYAGYLESSEHGSGTYESEETAAHSVDYIWWDGVASLSKSNHSVRYDETAVNVTSTRSVIYDSRWAESSMVESFNNPEYIAGSQRYATSIDADMTIRSETFNLMAKIESEFDGSGRFESNVPDFVSSEEYTGSFMVYKKINELDSNRIESSVLGVGFVRTDKDIGDNIAAYERGTGEYEVEELIDLDTSGESLKKDVNVMYSPVNCSYAPDRTVNRSMMWREGTRIGEKGASFISAEFSNIGRLEEDMVVVSARDMTTAANFSGKARYRIIFKDENEPSSTSKGSKELIITDLDLDNEWVKIVNPGLDDVNLTGWTLSDYDGWHYKFPDGFNLLSGSAVTVYTFGNKNFNSHDKLYWGYQRPIWNNDRDCAKLRDADRNLVDEYCVDRSSMDKIQVTPGLVYMDEEYEGDYSIERQISMLPLYDAPHISISSEGRVDHPGCDRLKYTITLVNDGNLDLECVFVRDIFPSGTTFIGASLQPFDLGSRFGNWSIPLLEMGNSVTIEIELQVTNRRDDYTNWLRAQTVYQYEKRGIVLERRVSATDTSVLEVNWTGCAPQNISASYRATSNPTQPNLLTYWLTVQNLAEEDMKIEATVSLPEGLRFINSTYPTSEVGKDQIAWTIDRLAPRGRGSISFMAEAEEDELFVSWANVRGTSLDDRKLASVDVGASVMVGDFALLLTVEDLDWLPCGECGNCMLPANYWNNSMMDTTRNLGIV